MGVESGPVFDLSILPVLGGCSAEASAGGLVIDPSILILEGYSPLTATWN